MGVSLRFKEKKFYKALLYTKKNKGYTNSYATHFYIVQITILIRGLKKFHKKACFYNKKNNKKRIL